MEEETKKEPEKKIVEVQKVENEKTETKKVENNSNKNMSIASLVLGIASIVFCYNWIVAIACGVLAIIFGIKSKQGEGKGMAKAGFILGIVGISLWLFFIVFIGSIIGLGTAAILSI